MGIRAPSGRRYLRACRLARSCQEDTVHRVSPVWVGLLRAVPHVARNEATAQLGDLRGAGATARTTTTGVIR
jgi:hypothetical protein